MTKKRISAALGAVLAVTALAGSAFARHAEDKNGKVVDSGSFGVYVSGKRVATETFTIKQFADSSLTTSKFEMNDGNTKRVQSYVMKLASNGNLISYVWKEESPEKAEAVVEPQDQFLNEHITTPDGKTHDQPFLMSASTVILDDYFFSQREILLWRYIATQCQRKPGQTECTLPKADFGIVIPRQHVSSMVSVEYVGPEQLEIHGVLENLRHFKMQPQGPSWDLWFDNQQRLVRVSIPETNTEVVRD